MGEPLSASTSKHKYAISRETIADNSSRLLRVGVDKQTGETVALALFPRGQQITPALESSLIRCMEYHHPHIATLRDIFVTDSDLVAVFDFAGRDTLQQFIIEQDGLSEDDARYIFQQLVVSVDYQLRIGAPARGIHMDDVFIERKTGKVRLSVFRVLSTEDASRPAPLDKAAPAKSLATMKRTASPGLNLFRTSSPGLLTKSKAMDEGRLRDLGEMLYFLLHARFQAAAQPGRDGSPGSDGGYDSRGSDTGKRSTVPKLTASCADLLKRLLGKQKPTASEIMKHPWFLIDFPKGLKEMNAYCLKLGLSPEGRQAKVQRLRRVLAQARNPVPADGYPILAQPPSAAAQPAVGILKPSAPQTPRQSDRGVGGPLPSKGWDPEGRGPGGAGVPCPPQPLEQARGTSGSSSHPELHSLAGPDSVGASLQRLQLAESKVPRSRSHEDVAQLGQSGAKPPLASNRSLAESGTRSRSDEDVRLATLPSKPPLQRWVMLSAQPTPSLSPAVSGEAWTHS